MKYQLTTQETREALLTATLALPEGSVRRGGRYR